MEKTGKESAEPEDKKEEEDKNVAMKVRKAEKKLYNAAYSYAEVLSKYSRRDIWSEEAVDLFNAGIGDAVRKSKKSAPFGNYSSMFKFHL
jgi:hypothetical protein